MANLTIFQIIQKAVELEESTRDFYLKAKEMLAGQNHQGTVMLQSLADEEENHKKLLQDADIGRIKDAYVAYEPDFMQIQWNVTDYMRPGMTASEIQKVALEHEKLTRDFYKAFAKNLPSKQLSELFETLATFEEQHIHKITTEFGHYYGS